MTSRNVTLRPDAPRPDAPSRAGLVLLVLEGYAYLALILAVFALVAVVLGWGLVARRPLIAIIAVFLGLPLTFTMASAMRALWFRRPGPEGVPLARAAAPALYDRVEGLRVQLGAPRVHAIVVSTRCNASAVRVPRLGLFFPRNVLVLGYPLFFALRPEELDAVIVHELAHLSGGHGWVSAWVYRTRLSWYRMMDALSSRGVMPLYVLWIHRTYLPRLRACSAAIARDQERFADRRAAEVAGEPATAAALVALEVGGALIGRRYWPRVHERVLDEPEPPRPFAAMREELVPCMEESSAEPLRAELAATAAADDDTHPSLAERLAAVGHEIRPFSRPDRCAADVYVGAAIDAIAATLDAEWQATHAEEWRTEHADLSRARTRRAELAGVAAPTADETFEQGTLTERLEGVSAALPFYRRAAGAGHARAGLAAGRILLEGEDADGITLIERAMEAEPSLVPDGCRLLERYHESRGRLVEAHRSRIRARQHVTRTRLATGDGGALREELRP